MNRKCILLAVLIFAWWLPVHAQQTNPRLTKEYEDKDKKELLALEYNWLKAEFSLDTAHLATLMDDSFTGISASGTTTKQQELLDYYNIIGQRIRDSIFIDSFRLENAVVNLYGTTAVITFIVHTFRKEKGVAAERKTRFYDVWIKRNGKWKAVASQGTRVTE